MKKICLALCALAVLPVSAQNYTISGKAPANVKTVYLQRLSERAPFDSVTVKNGAFQFSGNAGDDVFVYVMQSKNEGTLAVLDGNITVDFSADAASGTAENDSLSAWNKRFSAPMKRNEAAMSEYYSYHQSGKNIPDSVMQRIENTSDEAQKEMARLVKLCCEQHRTMKFPAVYLSQMGLLLGKEDVIQLAEEGNPAYMNTKIVEGIKRQLTGWKRQMPGTMFTDLSLADTDGKAHKLSDYVGKGKYVLIDFWASWCGPCRHSMPEVKKLYDAYKDKGFDIVGVSLDEDKAAWKGAIKKLELPWHHLSDLKGWKGEAAQTYGINAIPATLLIGPDGKIVASEISAEQVAEKLKDILK